MHDAMRLFRTGLVKYRQRKWQDAISEFTEVLALNPNDKAAKLYVERSEHFRDNAPPDDWEGVWVMQDK
jgi:adenylate cyclase